MTNMLPSQEKRALNKNSNQQKWIDSVYPVCYTSTKMTYMLPSQEQTQVNKNSNQKQWTM